jgi:hypothetical protein
MPRINRDLGDRAVAELSQYSSILVLENHNPARAKYDILSQVAEIGRVPQITRLAVEGIPVGGQAAEVLAYHRLDASSIRDELEVMLRG